MPVLPDEGVAHRRERHDRDAVLVLEAVRPFGLEHADDREGLAADLDLLSDDRGPIGLLAEQVLDVGGAEHDDVGVRVVLLLGEAPAPLDGVVAHRAEVGRRSLDLLGVVVAPLSTALALLTLTVGTTWATSGALCLSLERLHVGVGDRHLAALGAATATEPETAGDDGERVRAETFELLAARGRRAAPDCDEHDDRRDADHDAERRERGAQLVGDDAAQRDRTLERFMTAPPRELRCGSVRAGCPRARRRHAIG